MAATAIGFDAVTQGTWRDVYGASGRVVIGDGNTLPAYVTSLSFGGLQHTWSAHETVLRATQYRSFTSRLGAARYHATTFDVTLTVTADTYVSLYHLDWDTDQRRGKVDVLEGGSIVATLVLDFAFDDGVWTKWHLTAGTYTFRLTRSAGHNIVLAAMMFDIDSVQTNRVTSAALRVWLTAAGTSQPNRVTSAALRTWLQQTVPFRPTIEVSALVRALAVQTSLFRPAPQTPDDEHLSTTYEVAETTDPDFASPVLSVTYDAPSDQILFAILDGLTGAHTYLVRTRHTGTVGDSPWSLTAEATTLEAPVPSTPTVSVLDVGEDYVSATTSAFSHPDGQTTQAAFDPANPLPYLAGVHWQIRVVSSGTVIVDTGMLPPLSDPPTFFEEDLADGTAYQIRAKHYDGYRHATSAWSAWVSFSTDAIPPVRPDAPALTVVNCDGKGEIEVSTAAFSPHLDDPGGTHQATRYRARLIYVLPGQTTEAASVTVVTTTPSELLAYTWRNFSGGTWTFDAAHQDDSGRWSLYGTSDTCKVEWSPSVVEMNFRSGRCIKATTSLTWEAPVWPEGYWYTEGGSEGGAWFTPYVWVYDGEISGDGGLTWTRVFTGRSARSWLFEVGSRANGSYLFRVRGAHTAGTIPGDWSYTVVRLDRSCPVGVHYDFSELTELDPEWEVLWATADVTWDAVDFNLGAGGGYGIRARNNAWYSSRGSVLAFPELGEVEAYEAEIEFVIMPRDDMWQFWRFAETNYNSCGLAHRARGYTSDNTKAGVAHLINSGGQPWFCAPTGLSPQRCDGSYVHTHQKTCCGSCQLSPYDGTAWCLVCAEDCPYLGCVYCRNCAQENIRAAMGGLLGRMVRYAIPISNGGLTHTAYRSGAPVFFQYGSTSVPSAGALSRGLQVAHRRGDLDSCASVRPTYVLRQRVTRTVDGGTRIQSQVLGPGLDPTAGWTYDRTLTYAQTQSIECGYVGLAIGHIGNALTGPDSVVFKSFSLAYPEFEICEPPPPDEYDEPEYEPSRPCEVIVRVYHEDKTTLNWEIGDAPDHPNPYLVELEHYGEQEIDIVHGAATIGQCAWLAIDRAQTVMDQASGWLTERISRIHGLRNRILRYIDEVRGWVVIADGPASAPTLDESYAAYRATVRDTRDTERKVEVFVEASSSWLLPMGLPDGFGAHINGDGDSDWLVSPQDPLVGTYRILGTTYERGWVDLKSYWPGGWTVHPSPNEYPVGTQTVPEEITVLEEIERLFTSPGTPLGNPRPVYYDWPDLELLWRASGSADEWTVVEPIDYIVDGESFAKPAGVDIWWPPRLLARIRDAEIADGTEVRAASWIMLRGLLAEGDFPNDTDAVEIAIRYKGKPSTFAPMHLEGMTTGELLKDLYDGLYSRPDPLTGEVVPSGIRYNEADLLEMTDLVLMRITEPVEDLRAWTEKYIYAPTGWVPALNNDGEISPRSQVPPLTWDGLLEVNNAITEPQPEWSAGERIVNVLTLTYPRYYEVDLADADAIDRLASREVSHEFRDESSIDRHAIQAVTYDGSAFAAVGDEFGEPVLTVRDELGWTHADNRRLYILYRYSDGARSIEVPVMREECALLRAGDWVTLDLSWFPNTATGRRVLSGVGGQVLAIHDVDCAWRILWIEVTSLLPEGS